MELDLEKFQPVPIASVTKTPTKTGLWALYAERFWAVYDDCILLYRGQYPQCNEHQSIAERLAPEAGDVRYLATVWLPVDWEGRVSSSRLEPYVPKGKSGD